jgi:4'-phosphopantetheinyl transferase
MKGRRLADCSFELGGRIIHVWCVGTDVSPTVAAQFEHLLAPEEKRRAARFRFHHLQCSFVVARGALRVLLGRYLRVHPASIQFNHGPKGKPAVTGSSPVEFNASRSGALALFAFTVGCEIGVDLEQVHSLSDAQSIADRFFCSDEAADLMSLPSNERERAFFLCWTRKEAYVKAIGDGLSSPLDAFRVTLRPHEPARFVHIAQDANAAKAWKLYDLQVAPNYAAALAYRDKLRPVSVFPVIDPAALLALDPSP